MGEVNNAADHIPGLTPADRAIERLKAAHFHAEALRFEALNIAAGTDFYPADMRTQFSLAVPRLDMLLHRITRKDYRDDTPQGEAILNLHATLRTVVTRFLADPAYRDNVINHWQRETQLLHCIEQIAYDCLEAIEKRQGAGLARELLQRVETALGPDSLDGLRKEVQHRRPAQEVPAA